MHPHGQNILKLVRFYIFIILMILHKFLRHPDTQWMRFDLTVTDCHIKIRKIRQLGKIQSSNDDFFLK